MIYGVDTLGAPKYGKAFLSIPRKFAVRSFATTFGNFEPFARKWCASGGLFLGVDLLWDDAHKYGDKNVRELRKLCKIYEAVKRQFPLVDLELSPFTEHNLSNPDKYLDIAQESAPNCTIVNNPWKGALSRKYKNEVHGSMKAPNGRYNYSGDGGLDFKPDNAELVDCDITKLLQKHSNCERFYFWHSRNNGRYSMKDKTPRPNRSYWPTKEFLASEIYEFTDKGNISLPKGWSVKSHSEHHGKGEVKGDKLLIICPHDADFIILKRGSKVIVKLKSYGPFDGGGFRYYAPDFGYKYGANLEVYIGSKKYGVCNGGFRTAPFRGKI